MCPGEAITSLPVPRDVEGEEKQVSTGRRSDDREQRCEQPEGCGGRRLIAGGLSNAEIGQELFISDTTVKTHVTHILQKLNLRDRVQLVVFAYQTRLLETDARQP